VDQASKKEKPRIEIRGFSPPHVGTQEVNEAVVISRKSNHPEKAHPTIRVILALQIFVIAFFMASPFSFVLQVAVKFLHTVCKMQ
jgi:ABC-type Na+ efflux pump permease subunit